MKWRTRLVVVVVCGVSTKSPPSPTAASTVTVWNDRPCPLPPGEPPPRAKTFPHAVEPRRVAFIHDAAPAELLFDWPGDDANGRVEDSALALVEDDAHNRALACPDARVDAAVMPGAHRCRFQTATWRIGGNTYWAAAASEQHDHESMYGVRQEVVLLAPQREGLHVVATLTQWDEDVFDCGSRLKMRRGRVLDVDGDGVTELCIETVEEQGPALEPGVRQWKPFGRRRWTEAYRAQPTRLVRAPDVAARCPASGYGMFVDLAPIDDALAWRRSLQGTPPVARCPYRVDACGNESGCAR